MSRKLRESAQRLLDAERGTVYKDRGGKLSVCLVYPNTYSIGMSSLGYQGIYGLLNARPDVVCERAFLPPPEEMDEYRRTGEELCSLESQSPLGSFEVVAFSVSFENDYPAIPRMLEMARIPARASERTSSHPLVIAGGVCPSANPEPIAPIFDICFTGEAEEMLGEFVEAYKASGSREELLKRALQIPGLYVPAFYDVSYNPDGTIAGRVARDGAPERITRRIVSDLSAHPMRSVIITPNAEFGDMCLIEPMRGCPWQCRFCLAGHLYRPPRRKGGEALMAEVQYARGMAGRVGMVGPSLSDHPDMPDVLTQEGVEFSLTSLRASPKSAGLAKLLRGARSVSIAPETGSDRLREFVNKKVTRAEIIESARLILGIDGIERLRLYFMVGLPSETDEEALEIAALVREIREAAPRGKLILTLSVFVPKAGTPFERMPMARPDVVKRRLGSIKKALVRVHGVSVFHDVPKYAFMQGLFSVGDRRVAEVILTMGDNIDWGATGTSSSKIDWRTAAKRVGVDPEFFIHREKPLTERLPWEFIAGA